MIYRQNIAELWPIIEQLNKFTPPERVEFFRDPRNFFLWWFYYFPQNFETELADFHFVWIHYLLETDLSLLFEAFRWAIKTEIVKMYLVWCICYAVEPYIVVQSFDSSSSDDMVRNIAKTLSFARITSDYWFFFPFESSREDLAKKAANNFNTTNWVKVVARSLNEKLRWASNSDEELGSSRPTLLVLDDIDTTDSTRNKEIIDKYYKKLNQETIGALSKKKSRIIFLWNTITTDGIVRRFANNKKSSKFWKVFWQPLIVNGKITWDYFTPEKVNKLRDDESEWFPQNYLLIPEATTWTRVLKQNVEDRVIPYLAKVGNWTFYDQPTDQIAFGIDVSEGKEKSDFMAITGKKNGKTILQYHWRVNEIQLAKDIDWLLSYTVMGKRYTGNWLVESNTWRALINEIMRYEWWDWFLLRYKSIKDLQDEDTESDEIWFRTTTQSKDFLIKQYSVELDKVAKSIIEPPTPKEWLWITDGVWQEIQTYIWDNRWRANAQSWCHDDLLISEMLAVHVEKNYDLKKWNMEKRYNMQDRVKEDVEKSWRRKVVEEENDFDGDSEEF